MATYCVTCDEIHQAVYEVEAESPEHALALFRSNDPRCQKIDTDHYDSDNIRVQDESGREMIGPEERT